MKLSKVWSICEETSNTLYAGNDDAGKPVFLPLCDRTRFYRSNRAADSALRCIRATGYEGFFDVVYQAEAEIPDPPPKARATPQYRDFDELCKFGKVRYLRRSTPLEVEYAMTTRTGELVPLGNFEMNAWRRFMQEVLEAGEERIRARGGDYPFA